MWTNLFILLFIIYVWGCVFEYFRVTCAMNKRFDDQFDLYMEEQAR